MGMARRIENRQDFDELLRAATNYERMPEFHAGRVRIDLTRMHRYVERLGHPELAMPAVHITGSKGKGSTAALTARILGFVAGPVGLHTSPHLHRMEERVAVDQRPIGERDLFAATNDILDAQADGPDPGFPTYFELMTLVAFLHFRRVGARFAVHEVGLGGRLDATNVLRPCAVAITNIELEHAAILGGTLEAIAEEKGGIIKGGAPVITGVPPGTAPFAVLARIAAQHASPLLLLGRDITAHATSRGPLGQEVTVRTTRRTYDRLQPALLGSHQADNLALAIALAEHAAEVVGQALDQRTVRSAVLGFGVPGRLEIVPGTPPVVIDGAHTGASIAAALRAVREAFPGKRVVALFALAVDKERTTCARAVARADLVVTTRYDHPRATDPDQLAAEVQRAGGRAEVAAAPGIGLDRARELAEKQGLVLVVGSLYLAGELRRAVDG